MSHHHTYYVTSSYILCHIIIHTMSHHHTCNITSSNTPHPSPCAQQTRRAMSHHHTYYVTSSLLCHITIHTMSHHHTCTHACALEPSDSQLELVVQGRAALSCEGKFMLHCCQAAVCVRVRVRVCACVCVCVRARACLGARADVR